MADWYVNYGNGSTTGYYAVAQWQSTHAYSIGAIIRQLATPSVGNERCFRCTTGGTSGATEPSWSLSKGATTTSGSAVFTEITGNATYNWSAPFARLSTPVSSSARISANDRVFVADIHAETQASSIGMFSNIKCSVICVDHTGSVPPVSADLRTSATVSTTGASVITLSNSNDSYIYGIQFQCGTGSSSASLAIQGVISIESCALGLTNSGATSSISTNTIRLRNTTLSFSATGQTLAVGGGDFVWTDTATALSGTAPTKLITVSGDANVLVDSVDLSSLGTGKNLVEIDANGAQHVTLLNCALGSGVTIQHSSSTFCYGSNIDLLNSDSGATGYRQERYAYSGALTTDTVNVRLGGATDGVQAISWKVTSNTKPNVFIPFETFPIAEWNATIGSIMTASVEILNDGTNLQNTDVWLEVHSLSDAGSPLGLLSSTYPGALASGSNVPSSFASWTTTGITTPIAQKLSVTFTPTLAAYVRAVLKIAKPSKTVWIDPLLAIS